MTQCEIKKRTKEKRCTFESTVGILSSKNSEVYFVCQKCFNALCDLDANLCDLITSKCCPKPKLKK